MPRVTIITENELIQALRSNDKSPLVSLYYQHQMKARDLQRRIRSFAVDAGRHAATVAERPEDAFSVRLAQSAANDMRVAYEELAAVKDTLSAIGGVLDEMAICVPGWERE